MILCLLAPLSHSPFPRCINQSGIFLSLSGLSTLQGIKNLILTWNGGSPRDPNAQPAFPVTSVGQAKSSVRPLPIAHKE
ncbi:hypothetical protein TNIN_426561 [Trichonephila inaurata madagascariensis]|uniref:Uncharacterized protein n=1 Tax=Trichonephila inaurata madagascariensis TaxID=2747483 RepID=A0A8X6XFG2_9ARAC|nr:hypothetical protein TNIN_426561 [Trichonephila inaurata madagascariensis]